MMRVLVMSCFALVLVFSLVPAPDQENLYLSKTLPGLKLVRIPAHGKTFTMGSPKTEASRWNSEAEHEVTFTADYYLGVTHVTRSQFAAFVKDESYQTKAEKAGEEITWRNPGFEQTEDHPVVWVSWNDAMAFCKWLSHKDGREYRLPTEAQWEYACRAGTKTAYCFGDDPKKLGHYAWFDDNSQGATHAVGMKKPNLWGLHDMHGNAWQWCADWSAKYPKGAVTDPQGPKEGSDRVFRGGSWSYSSRYCRSAFRFGHEPEVCDNGLGFRLSVPAR
jgi:formylglycine-generating enzyme required for sulfatase activity